MKIAIDARLYGLENAGIGRYVTNLVLELEKIDKKNEYMILLRRKYFDLLELQNDNFHKVLADFPHYSLAEQIFLPYLLYRLHPDLAHFLHFNAPIFYFGRQVITIHDLIKNVSRGLETTTRGKFFYWVKYFGYRWLIDSVIRRADKIITPSHWWEKELIKGYGLDKNKITVTYEGVDDVYRSGGSVGGDIVLKKYDLSAPFVIYTGNLYPHKNIERLVEAMKLINRKRPLHLVVVCSRGVFFERFRAKIEKTGMSKLVHLLGFVPDEELVFLYRAAKAFVFPSLLEGFGLPGLEAMAVGLPVVASDSSCLPEIYGQAAIYFNPLDVNDIASKIEIMIRGEKLRKGLIALGKKRAGAFSWEKMAKETLAVYNSLAFS